MVGSKTMKREFATAKEARLDATGVLIARLIDMVQEGKPVGAATKALMGDLMDSPARMGSAVLVMAGMIEQLADAKPGGFAKLTQYLVDAIPQEV